MQIGKVKNSILKRSVLRQARQTGNDAGASLMRPVLQVGCDAAVLYGGENTETLASTGYGLYPVFTAVNNLAAFGAKAAAAQCCVLLPETAQEDKLRKIIDGLSEDCRQLCMPVSGGHTQVTGAVSEPVVSVTAIGFRPAGTDISSANAKPGQDIVMTKWAGLGGVREIIRLRRDELEAHYRDDVIRRAEGNKSDLSVVKEAALAAQHGVCAMHDVSQGGIFAALWDMAEASHVGMKIDLRAIPVCQEAVEVCELFGLNPYELESCGCLLMTSDAGYDIVELLEKEGVPAAVIGSTTEGKARAIYNRDDVRYLETPKADEIYHFMAKGQLYDGRKD